MVARVHTPNAGEVGRVPRTPRAASLACLVSSRTVRERVKKRKIDSTVRSETLSLCAGLFRLVPISFITVYHSVKCIVEEY